jgi:hypothetical protein
MSDSSYYDGRLTVQRRLATFLCFRAVCIARAATFLFLLSPEIRGHRKHGLIPVCSATVDLLLQNENQFRVVYSDLKP